MVSAFDEFIMLYLSSTWNDELMEIVLPEFGEEEASGPVFIKSSKDDDEGGKLMLYLSCAWNDGLTEIDNTADSKT